MRIRQVRPEFWTDPTIGRLPIAARHFYIGLWNVADDGGWLSWAPSELGALLFPYETPTRRERDIEKWGKALMDAGRLILHPCGCAEVPTLPKHQRISGKLSYTQRDKHQRHTQDHLDKQSPLSDKQSPLSDSPVTLGNVTLGNGTLAREGLPHLSPEVQEAGEAITGRGILSAGDRQLTELDRLVEVHGPEAVIGAFSALTNGGHLEWRQLVWGAMKRLEPIPGAPDSKAERERDEQSTHERRKAAEARALDEPWRRELREKLRQAEAAR